MHAGLLFCFLGAISFGLLGAVSKLAERKKCDASPLIVSLMAWAALFMLFRTVSLEPRPGLPAGAMAVAIACGICASVAALAFQLSMQTGKVTIGWLMMNLSTGLPAVVSIWLYHEALTPLKLVALLLALVALVLLFRGHGMDARERSKPGGKGGQHVVPADARHSAD